MNQVLAWLSGGDIRSDGVSSDVAQLVLKNENLYSELLEGIWVDDDLVRGRTADALEKIARSRPDLLIEDLPVLMQVGQEDGVPMVRWHIAMLLGHLAIYEEHIGQSTATLLHLLRDKSVFVKSWSIVSLCIIGRIYPDECNRIIKAIFPLQRDASVAIRSRVKKALPVLIHNDIQFPKGWVKSDHIQDLLTG